jgi:hypothetical protein
MTLDKQALRRLALCTTMIAIRNEKGEDQFAEWWEANPRLPFVDESADDSIPK